MNFIVTAKRTETHCKQKYISLIMQVSVKEEMSGVSLKKFLMGSWEVGWGTRSVVDFYLLFFRLLLLTILLSAQKVKMRWRNATHIKTTYVTRQIPHFNKILFILPWRTVFLLLNNVTEKFVGRRYCLDTLVCSRGRKNQNIASTCIHLLT